MSEILPQVAVILLLIAVGGLFAAAEMALVSLREGQLRALEKRGNRGQAVARLVADPNRFLAAIQVGVTLAGMLSAAFGAAALSGPLAEALVSVGLNPQLAETTSVVVVTMVIAYLSLVFSELVPKRIARQRTESVALLVAGPLDRIATLVRPVIWLLSASTNLVVRIFGGDPKADRAEMTPDELRGLLMMEGVLGSHERRLIDQVFGASALQVREVMRPRTEVHFLDANQTVQSALPEVLRASHSRYPVVRGSPDEVVGMVHVRDLAGPMLRRDRTCTVGSLAREVKRIPGTNDVLVALAEMRREGAHLTVVVDEYGGTAGIITLEDLVEQVVGDIRDEYDVELPGARRLAGGDTDVDGLVNLAELESFSGLKLPEGPYETVAGFVMSKLGRLPRIGDEVRAEQGGARYCLEVTEMDGRRASRLRLRLERTDETGSDGETPGPGSEAGEQHGSELGEGRGRTSTEQPEGHGISTDKECGNVEQPGRENGETAQ